MNAESVEGATPNFAAWSTENLANYAKDAYTRIKALEAANDQLRVDLRDAMQLLRSASCPPPPSQK
jgi:hypothetical protein